MSTVTVRPAASPIGLLPWLPLVVLPAVAMLAGDGLPPWVRMLCVAGGTLVGLKWLTWANFAATGATRDVSPLRMWGYLLAWPGMNPRAFCDDSDRPETPSFGRWVAAAGQTLFGATLFFGVAPNLPREWPEATGLVGMAGFIFLLHFGLFELLALAWQAAGVRAESLMNAPIAATSLAEFWGRRWNMAFRDAAHDLVGRPLTSTLGTTAALAAVFLVSGLLHEVAISIPAAAGYGWPTLYFLVQAGGMFVERSRWGRAIGLGRGAVGWCFTALVIVGPVLWLFHGPFLRSVIGPMVRFEW